MNILFLSTENPFPPDHGHHIRTYHILKSLAKHHRIYFLAFAKTAKEVELKTELEKFCATVDIVLLPHRRPQIYAALLANMFSPEPFILRRYDSIVARERIREILASHQIDVIHFDLPHLAAYLDEVVRFPKILTNHNVESLRLRRWAKIERNPFLKLYLYYQYLKLHRFESKLCPQFDCCITVSDFDKQTLREMCQSDNFITIPNGVDIDYFSPGNGTTATGGLVWAGSMSGAYNRDAVDYFLSDIEPLIHARLPEVKMTFVGAAPTELLRRRAKENHHIVCTDYVDDVRPYVDRASIFIAPLRSGSGTKIKVLNAMAQAKPVVTTSIGAEGIVATPDEEIVIADDAHEFAGRVMALLENPKMACEIGQRARKRIEALYDWKSITASMNKIYEQAKSQRALPPA
jgi:sugar transferase (PEP-CTERM/EpsH1 system associated)